LAPLLRVPLFTDLKPLQITEIARQAERIRFRAGDIVLEAGQPMDGAYLIVTGSAEQRISMARGSRLERIEPGSLIGELAMFIDYVPASTVVALDRVCCLKLTRTALRDQMRSDQGLARHFEDILIGRLEQAGSDLRDVDRLLEAAARAWARRGVHRKAPNPGGGLGARSASCA
jgi:CRP-like cAMP-binding protein